MVGLISVVYQDPAKYKMAAPVAVAPKAYKALEGAELVAAAHTDNS